jgi:hypothetical protein
LAGSPPNWISAETSHTKESYLTKDQFRKKSSSHLPPSLGHIPQITLLLGSLLHHESSQSPSTMKIHSSLLLSAGPACTHVQSVRGHWASKFFRSRFKILRSYNNNYILLARALYEFSIMLTYTRLFFFCLFLFIFSLLYSVQL